MYPAKLGTRLNELGGASPTDSLPFLLEKWDQLVDRIWISFSTWSLMFLHLCLWYREAFSVSPQHSQSPFSIFLSYSVVRKLSFPVCLSSNSLISMLNMGGWVFYCHPAAGGKADWKQEFTGSWSLLMGLVSFCICLLTVYLLTRKTCPLEKVKEGWDSLEEAGLRNI